MAICNRKKKRRKWILGSLGKGKAGDRENKQAHTQTFHFLFAPFSALNGLPGVGWKNKKKKELKKKKKGVGVFSSITVHC